MMQRILRFWWGNKLSTMSPDRHRCYRSIIRNSGIAKIEMITPDNYKDYEVEGYPIHPAFQYLSEVHKSDYLRAYVTYHHGGCWTDVKYIDHDWNIYFDMLDNAPDKMGIGYQEMIIMNGEYRIHDPSNIHYRCLSMGHFIFREKTPIFENYISLIDKHLDGIVSELEKYPGTVHPLACLDNHQHSNFPEHLRSYPYPITWMGISWYFFHTQLPYIDRIMYGMPPSHNFMTGFNHR